MITVKYQGRLGNNLFQYSIGRILAQELNYTFQSPPIPNFSELPIFISASTIPESIILEGHILNKEDILKRKNESGFVIHGFFQRYEYYQPYKDIIRSWFNSVPLSEEDQTIVIHVRRTQPHIDTQVEYKTETGTKRSDKTR